MRSAIPLILATAALAKPVLFQNEDSYGMQQAYWGQENTSPCALPGDNKQSIYDVLKADPEFSYVVKAMDFTGAAGFYQDSSQHLTFFAPPNKSFPKHPHHDHDHDHDDNDELLSVDPGRVPLNAVMSQVEALENGDHDDKEKERRRKVLKAIAHAILSYHTLPDTIDSLELTTNTTQQTALILPKELNNAQALRIKVSTGAVIPTVRLNFITRVIEPDVAASNGLIHVISFPLIPPFPGFAELFQVPSAFSVLTSAIQRTRIADELDIRFVHGHDDHKGQIIGAKAVTVFAPTNKAFARLPKKLQFFLFSPFGTNVLRKVLQFHIVPDFVIHSDYAYNATAECHSKGLVPPEDSPVYDVKKTLPTLLANHTLEVHIAKYNFTIPFPGPKPSPPRVVTKFEVEGNKVIVTDIPAANGAVHVIDHLLNPMKHHDHHPRPRMPLSNFFAADNSWENWEDWLMEWAVQN